MVRRLFAVIDDGDEPPDDGLAPTTKRGSVVGIFATWAGIGEDGRHPDMGRR